MSKPPQRPRDIPDENDVLIAGGGIAGLACGVALSDAGLRVAVLERDSRLGGRASSWSDPATGDVVDIGPHVLLTHYRNMLRLLERLGTREHVVWHTDKLITLVDGARPVVMRLHRAPAPLPLVPSLLAAPAVSMRDKLSNARVSWFAMKMSEADVLRLDALDARTFLQQMGVSERFIEWFWASAAMTIENVPLSRCSAGSLMRLYRHLIGHNAYRFGFPDVGLSDLFAPAAAAAIQAAGGCVATGAEVAVLTGGDGRVSGALLADGRRLRARRCVAAVAPQDLPPLLRSFAQPDFARAREFEPSPYISSYLWFTRKLGREQFWARVWAPENFNYDSYDLSNIRAGWAARPSLIASNIIYSHRAANLSDDEIVRATVRELSDFLPAAATTPLRHARVHRIAMAKPASLPGIERMRPPTRTPVHGLFLAGDWIRTCLPMSMESAVRAGYLAAEEVLAELGRPRTLALPPPPAEGLTALAGRLADARRRTRSPRPPSLS